MIKKAPATLKTRKIAVLISDGVDAALIASLRQAVEKEGAELVWLRQKSVASEPETALGLQPITRSPRGRPSFSMP